MVIKKFEEFSNLKLIQFDRRTNSFKILAKS